MGARIRLPGLMVAAALSLALPLGGGCVWKPIFNPPGNGDAGGASDAATAADGGRNNGDAAAGGDARSDAGPPYADATVDGPPIPGEDAASPADAGGTADYCQGLPADASQTLPDGAPCPGTDAGEADAEDATTGAGDADDVVDAQDTDAGDLDAGEVDGSDLDASDDAAAQDTDAGDDATAGDAACEAVACQAACEQQCADGGTTGSGACLGDACECVCL